MEKYAKLMKGLEMCAGPNCCKDACPYYNETAGGRTCRSWLLSDAAAAIANEEAGSETLQELLQSTEAERDKLRGELENAIEMRRSVEAHRDAIDNDRAELYQHRNKLIEKNKVLQEALDNLGKAYENLCTVRDGLNAENNALHDEINALVLKTDRKSVGTDGRSADWWRGRAEILEWFVREWFREGGFQS